MGRFSLRSNGEQEDGRRHLGFGEEVAGVLEGHDENFFSVLTRCCLQVSGMLPRPAACNPQTAFFPAVFARKQPLGSGGRVLTHTGARATHPLSLPPGVRAPRGTPRKAAGAGLKAGRRGRGLENPPPGAAAPGPGASLWNRLGWPERPL